MATSELRERLHNFKRSELRASRKDGIGEAWPSGQGKPHASGLSLCLQREISGFNKHGLNEVDKCINGEVCCEWRGTLRAVLARSRCCR